MKFLLTILLVFLHCSIFCQSPYQHWQWAKSFGGSGNDSSVDMKIKNGYLYVTGTFTSAEINWDNNLLINKGGKDIFVAKLDTNGTTIWVKQFGGAGDDIASQLEINNSGTLVIRCSSSGDSVFVGNVMLTNPASFYTELDENGNLLNAVVLPPLVLASDIDVDYSGAVYVGVKYQNPFSFADSLVDTSQGGHGAAILKYDNTGISEWARFIRLVATGSVAAPLLECSHYDSSINSLWYFTCQSGAIMFEQSYSNQYYGNLYTKISSTGNKLNIKNFVAGSFSSLLFRDFETGGSGLDYSFTFNLFSNGTGRYVLSKWYNTERLQSIEFWDRDSVFGTSTGHAQNPFNLGSLKVNETGNYLLANRTQYDRYGNLDRHNNIVEVLDSNLNRILKANIVDGNMRNWNIKCMADTNALYFTNSYTTNQLALNENLPLTTTITLVNNGAANIFIGKCRMGVSPYVYVTVRNGTWTDPIMWWGRKLPAFNSDVIVMHNITINENITVNSLKLIAPATVNVQSGFTLTVLH